MRPEPTSSTGRYAPAFGPLGYRRHQPPKRPKLDPFTDIIDRILADDRTVHRKQRHTSKRIFERLRDEHGFSGGQTIVKDYVREQRRGQREMFVPLVHPPGHAQVDFVEADAIIAGVKLRAHFFAMSLPHSDACFIVAYPATTTEAWLDGHNASFTTFGEVPLSILYDNDKCLVSRILADGGRLAMPLYRDTWASPRRARLAENHGKPSLWVFITGPWYSRGLVQFSPQDACCSSVVVRIRQRMTVS